MSRKLMPCHSRTRDQCMHSQRLNSISCPEPAHTGFGKSGMARMAATILSLRGSPDIAAEKPCVYHLAGQQRTQQTEEGTVEACACARRNRTVSSPWLDCTRSSAADVLCCAVPTQTVVSDLAPEPVWRRKGAGPAPSDGRRCDPRGFGAMLCLLTWPVVMLMVPPEG